MTSHVGTFMYLHIETHFLKKVFFFFLSPLALKLEHWIDMPTKLCRYKGTGWISLQHSARQHYNSFFNKKEALGLLGLRMTDVINWQKSECLIIHLLWKALGKQGL